MVSRTADNPPERIAIVGASLAGLRAAETLRRKGYDGRLALIGAEPHLPYDRPPLSKEILQGRWEIERTALRKDGYEELELDLRLGRRATALDVAERRLDLDDGTSERWDRVLIATGAAARALPGQPELENLFLLRTLDDALALRAALERQPQRVVVVGAGFIGAEVAASCRARDLAVTVVEPQPVPLLRGLGEEMGALCAELHRDHGVDLRCGTGVDAILGDARVEGVRLGDGTQLAADVVVVGIGAAPATDWLAGSGLELDDGVVCDATCRAAPGIFAAGDVARWPNALFDETMRVEHWSNAVEQGCHAAENLLAGDGAAPFAPVPWFWSDQYATKIQFAGRMRGDDEMRVVVGSPEERRFVAIYGRAGRIVGVLAFSRPRDLIRYRRLIAESASFEDALAAS